MRSPFPFRCSFLLFAPHNLRPKPKCGAKCKTDSPRHMINLIPCHSIYFHRLPCLTPPICSKKLNPHTDKTLPQKTND